MCRILSDDMRRMVLGIFAATGLAGASNANAGVYDVTYVAGGETATIVLTTSDTPDPHVPGGFDILGVSGTLGSDAITGLVPTSSPGRVTSAPVGAKPIRFDNVFFPVAPNFDDYGLLFTTASNYFNLYFNGTEYLQLTPEQKDAGRVGDAVTAFSATAAPEPQTWILMILGFAGVGLVRYRRAVSEGIVRSV